MKKNTALFYSLRHGRTAGNEQDRYRGHSNEEFAQLSPDGRDDVREAAIFIKRAGLKFPLILCDDLLRAIETAKIASSILGIRTIEQDRRLRPLDVGEYTGKSKKQYPLDAYLENKNKKIPGGESMKQFNARLAKVSADILELVDKLKKPVLVIGHGSTASFWKAVADGSSEAGYESIVQPGGVIAYTSLGVFPLFKQKYDEDEKPALADGTALTGFVTVEQNRPPRECWNCRSAERGIASVLGCWHPLVQIDPQLQDRRQDDGSVAVKDEECCNNFRNKIAT